MLQKIQTLLLIGFFIGIIQSCTTPYSKEYIYSDKDDLLPLHAKVNYLLSKSVKTNDDVLLSAIALLYARNNNWEEAKRSVEKAIKLNPVNGTYHLYLAQYARKLQQYKLAYVEGKAAYELGAYDKKIVHFLAEMAVKTADTLHGEAYISNYVIANRASQPAQLLMADWLYLKNEYSESILWASRVLKQDSMNSEALRVTFNSLVNLDSIELAINFGKRLQPLDSSNAHFYVNMAQLYQAKGALHKAGFYFGKAYRIHPKAATLNKLIDIYQATDLYDSVIYYTSTKVALPDFVNYDLTLARARAFDKRYKYDSAFVVYNNLLKKDSTDSVVWAEQAYVQRKIAYLQRKKREQKKLADSLARVMPAINF